MISRTLVLEEERVRLEPLAQIHAEQLRAIGNDPALWEHTFQLSPFVSIESTHAWIDSAIAEPNQVAFAIVDKESGVAVGSTRYVDIQPQFRKLEIGWTFLARTAWRTHINTTCKFLLLQHAFERAHCVRVQLKAEALNVRSRAAMQRMGAHYEGTLRNFRIRPSDGRVCDVAFYSVIDAEWPTIRDRLRSPFLVGIGASDG